MLEELDADPGTLGLRAGFNGRPLTDNPWAPGTAEGKLWIQGWTSGHDRYRYAQGLGESTTPDEVAAARRRMDYGTDPVVEILGHAADEPHVIETGLERLRRVGAAAAATWIIDDPVDVDPPDLKGLGAWMQSRGFRVNDDPDRGRYTHTFTPRSTSPHFMPAAVKAAAQFEEDLAEVQAIIGASTDQLRAALHTVAEQIVEATKRMQPAFQAVLELANSVATASPLEELPELKPVPLVKLPPNDRLEQLRHGHAAVCPRHGPTRGGTCRRCRS